MALTAKQIADLDGSMEAARLAGLGTIVGQLAATGTVTTGSVLPVSASMCVVDTGLTTIYGFTAFMSGSPTTGMVMVSACKVDNDLNIKSWKFGSASSTNLVAATSFDTVQWIAVGED